MKLFHTRHCGIDRHRRTRLCWIRHNEITISTINGNVSLILLVLTLKNWIKIYIAIVPDEGWKREKRKFLLVDSVESSFFFFIFTHKAMMLSENKEDCWWRERKTLYVSITWRTHQDQGKKEKWMDGRKKKNRSKIFAYSQTTMRTLESFFFHFFFLHSTLTTHAQILLSLRYNIIPLYLNLATINLRKMVKRKIPLITSSVTQHTLGTIIRREMKNVEWFKSQKSKREHTEE